MNIYLLHAHPDQQGFGLEIADRYELLAKQAGHEVKRHDLGKMKFDPILRHGYRERMELEPDLVQAQEYLKWCDHWVIVYPVWWASVPALFKGYLDRVLLPGFAFQYHDNNPWWDKLLTGKSAHLIATSDAPSFWLQFAYRNSDINQLKQGTLKFCGFNNVKVTRFGRIKSLDKKTKEKHLKNISKIIPS